MTVQDIPALNASLNAVATALIMAGIVSIKRRRERAHRVFMVAALCVSAAFLVFYVLHKILMKGAHTPFLGEGFIRGFYYAMLASHILLAMAIVPLVLRTAWLGYKERRVPHVRWARVTYPIWLYVSVTGVLVYQFLYVWYPPAGP
jgi:putative membrane protein